MEMDYVFCQRNNLWEYSIGLVKHKNFIAASFLTVSGVWVPQLAS